MGNCCSNNFQANDENIPNTTNVAPTGSNESHHSDGSNVSNVVSNGSNGSQHSHELNGSDGSNGSDNRDDSNGSDNQDGSNGSNNRDGSNGSDNRDGSNGSDNRDDSNGSARLITRYFDWHNQEEPIFWAIEEQTGYFCWVHVVVDTLEGLYAITHNRQRIKLSKQELVDNLYRQTINPKYDPSRTTYSMSMEDAYNWIIENGLSLEQDYGSGIYEATFQDPKQRIPGCRIFNLTGVLRIYLNNHNEDSILEELDISPGAGVLILDSTQMYSLDADGVYSIAADTREDDLDDHGVVVTGYDDSGSRNVYWVRDSMKSRAPNEGHYRVSRASGVQAGQKNPVDYVLFPYGVSLSESSSTSNTL